MKAGIFVDTSAWYALLNTGDTNHARASAFLPMALAEYRELISTNLVIGETYTLIRSRWGHDAAWQFARRIRRSRRLRRIFVSEALEREAYELLESRPEQTFSFVDGTSFVVMKEQEIPCCFTFDGHFSAAGLMVLPGSA
ncbi:MAG: PIN domain-containing protein [Dehalococcoidia bacterium]|nr:PIN domain-containing protein [Dehalococcoidia bacterium]